MDVIDLRQPDSTAPRERLELRIAAEDGHFNSEHYMADFAMEVTIPQSMHTSKLVLR